MLKYGNKVLASLFMGCYALNVFLDSNYVANGRIKTRNHT